MDNDDSRGQESVFSTKVRAGKRRTYFFDVRKTKGDDYYITLTESTKRFNGEGYNRHKLFLYKEDFNRFLQGLQDTIGHVKTELMPDYDYEQFDRKHEEWDAQRREESKLLDESADSSSDTPSDTDTDDSAASPTIESEEDIDW